jgi:hypothetical protein
VSLVDLIINPSPLPLWCNTSRKYHFNVIGEICYPKWVPGQLLSRLAVCVVPPLSVVKDFFALPEWLIEWPRMIVFNYLFIICSVTMWSLNIAMVTAAHVSWLAAMILMI